MNKADLLKERMARIQKAIALEKPDRTPVVLLYALFAAKTAGMPFKDFCSSIANSAQAMIKTYEMCGDADGTDYLGFATYGLSLLWLSKVKIPGKDLRDDVPYQVAEAELLKVEDYDTILDKGWPEFHKEFLNSRVFNDVDPSFCHSINRPSTPKRSAILWEFQCLRPAHPFLRPLKCSAAGALWSSSSTTCSRYRTRSRLSWT